MELREMGGVGLRFRSLMRFEFDSSRMLCCCIGYCVLVLEEKQEDYLIIIKQHELKDISIAMRVLSESDVIQMKM